MTALRISVLGSGAWGTALASHMALQHDVMLWGRSAADVYALSQTRRSRYLPSIELSPRLQFSHELLSTLEFALSTHAANPRGMWVLAVPTQALRQVLMQLLQLVPAQLWPPVVLLCKGLEQHTHMLPHQIVDDVVTQSIDQPLSRLGVLTGPSFAEELANGLPCALAFACMSQDAQALVMNAVHHGLVRVYPTDDVQGAALGGALKNIMAIATGVCDGLALGANARAALITRGMVEMRRLAVVLGAQADTLYGLSGLGDLILTCTGALSRNRRVGMALASGAALPVILQELGQVAEGVFTAPVVAALAVQHGVDMPIVNAVTGLLNGSLTAQMAVEALMGRAAKQE